MKDLDAVYRQHAQTVYKFLLSQCRDSQTAEELTQETFYQAVPDRQAPVVSAFAEGQPGNGAS